MNLQNIACPSCGSNIVFDATLLLQGASFSCRNSNCNASIQLNNESKIATSNSMSEFEELKNNTLKQ